MLIGQKLPNDAGDLVFQLPAIPSEWQFLIDIIPAQLVAERLSRLSGVDCDTFRLSSYVVEDEYGLLPRQAEVDSRQLTAKRKEQRLNTEDTEGGAQRSQRVRKAKAKERVRKKK